MSLAWLLPIAIGMGAVGLLAFLWSLQSGQYEDLDGAAARVLLAPDVPDCPPALRAPKTRHDPREAVNDKAFPNPSSPGAYHEPDR